MSGIKYDHNESTKNGAIKDVVSCSGLFGRLFQNFFFITNYNTIVSIFLYVFIGIRKYEEKKFSTTFNTILYYNSIFVQYPRDSVPN